MKVVKADLLKKTLFSIFSFNSGVGMQLVLGDQISTLKILAGRSFSLSQILKNLGFSYSHTQ